MILAIGYGNFVPLEKVAAVLVYGSSPLKTLVAEMDRQHKVLDATRGKRVRSLVVLTSDQIMLCAVDANTLQNRCRVKQVSRNPAK